MKMHIWIDSYNERKLVINFECVKLLPKYYILGNNITMNVIYQHLPTSQHSQLDHVNGIIIQGMKNDITTLNINDINVDFKLTSITLDKCDISNLKYNNSKKYLRIIDCKISDVSIDRPLHILRIDGSYIGTITSPYCINNLHISYCGLGNKIIDFMDIPYVYHFFSSGSDNLIRTFYGYIYKGRISSIYLYSMNEKKYCIGGYYSNISRLSISTMAYLSTVII